MAWNPAASIIEKLGGESVVAEATQTAYTAPYRWQADKEKGGTGGRIPGKHIPALLDLAKLRQVELSADEFFAEPTWVDKKVAAATPFTEAAQ
jgi:hypothetical protein